MQAGAASPGKLHLLPELTLVGEAFLSHFSFPPTGLPSSDFSRFLKTQAVLIAPYHQGGRPVCLCPPEPSLPLAVTFPGLSQGSLMQEQAGVSLCGPGAMAARGLGELFARVWCWGQTCLRAGRLSSSGHISISHAKMCF